MTKKQRFKSYWISTIQVLLKNDELHLREYIAVFKTKNPEREPLNQVLAKSEIIIPSRTEAIVLEIITEEINFRDVLIEYPDSSNSVNRVPEESSFVDFSRNAIPVGIVNVGQMWRQLQKKLISAMP